MAQDQQDEDSSGPYRPGSGAPRKPRWKMLGLIILFHILAIIGLARAFAPDFTASVVDQATSLVTVSVTTQEIEPEATASPQARPEPDAGAAAPEGKKAKPREVVAPRQPVPIQQQPAPQASSTGNQNNSGARDAGPGTGAGGQGSGTGSGDRGNGQGSGGAAKAVKISGDINAARDYPAPQGGRSARLGTSVTIAITVGSDGRPKACRIHKPSPFPETDERTCQLAMERFTFRPATDRNGDPVQSVFGWRQDFYAAQ